MSRPQFGLSAFSPPIHGVRCNNGFVGALIDWRSSWRPATGINVIAWGREHRFNDTACSPVL